MTLAASARAGGFEIPDNGTQALGRGAAFVAKADDGTAIEYNPAGLARQRGTRLLVDGNFYFESYEFRRAGTFPDDPNDPATPWGGKPFPAVTNSGGPSFTPFVALSSDFGTFDRFTAAAGVFGPSMVHNRTFPLGLQGAPAGSRYDFVQSRSNVLYPTASAAYRVTRWLDVGLSAHLVLASLDRTQVSYVDAGACPNPEYQPCDSRGTLTANATALAGTLGVMVRPEESLAFGVSARTPVSLDGDGRLDPEAQRLGQIQLAPGQASVSTALPLTVRAGGRYVQMDRDFEVWDLELDGVYEGWSAAEGDGTRVRIAKLGELTNIDALDVHRYKDTFGLRAGGAYSFEVGTGVLTARLGGYYDSSATDFATTRLDYDTLAKVAGTLGVGYKIDAFTLEAAYAGVASVPRLVGAGVGDVRPLNLARNGRSVDGAGQTLPAVNEGAYRGFTHILSIGVTVTFDLFFGAPRQLHYGNPYEPHVIGERPPAQPPEAPEEPPPEE